MHLWILWKLVNPSDKLRVYLNFMFLMGLLAAYTRCPSECSMSLDQFLWRDTSHLKFEEGILSIIIWWTYGRAKYLFTRKFKKNVTYISLNRQYSECTSVVIYPSHAAFSQSNEHNLAWTSPDRVPWQGWRTAWDYYKNTWDQI